MIHSRDVQVRTVILQTQDGERLFVGLGPTQQVQGLTVQRGTSLPAGDRVEVTIRETPQGQLAKMRHTAPSASEQRQ